MLATSAVILLWQCTGESVRALDNGIDPANLGKGDWIYFLSQATNQLGGHVPGVRDVPSLMAFEKSQGMHFIVVKAGTGAADFPSPTNPQFTAHLVNEAHAAGLRIFGYTRSDGADVAGEIVLATRIYNLGADGFVIDAEAEWESANLPDNLNKALQLGAGIKTNFPTRFLAHAPFPIIGNHTTFPYKEFGFHCDAVMPQAYWKSIGVSPAYMVRWMDIEWRNWQNSLTGQWTNAIKPLAPVGQGWSPSAREITTGAEITAFVNALKNDTNPPTAGGYKGASYWRADLHNADMWTAIATNSIGDPNTNPPVIFNLVVSNITNASAIISWNTDTRSDSVVEIGTTTDSASSITNAALVYAHSITLSGLDAATTNRFRVKSTDAAFRQSVSSNFTFVTKPAGVITNSLIDN
ncbi:MAG: fibronectin type III domain-containing protein [Verrucomicrobia bacterium]|nr:fibronectin type III domain-containing protein [Verrucomicrobiota bacterium]